MGSPRRPTEFGYKARVADTADGFVIADVPERDGPVDGSLLDGAISKAKRAGMHVRSVYADRGFGTSTADAALAHQTPGVSGVMASTMLLAFTLVAGKRGRLLGVNTLASAPSARTRPRSKLPPTSAGCWRFLTAAVVGARIPVSVVHCECSVLRELRHAREDSVMRSRDASPIGSIPYEDRRSTSRLMP
jgi:hypothetical protein